MILHSCSIFIAQGTSWAVEIQKIVWFVHYKYILHIYINFLNVIFIYIVFSHHEPLKTCIFHQECFCLSKLATRKVFFSFYASILERQCFEDLFTKDESLTLVMTKLFVEQPRLNWVCLTLLCCSSLVVKLGHHLH